MTQDQYAVPLTRTDFYTRPGLVSQRSHVARFLRYLLFAVGLALLLTCLEGFFWALNPAHLFGNDATHSWFDFFSLVIHTPLLLISFLVEVALAYVLVQALARPLAYLSYLKAVGHAQDIYRARCTPVQTASYPYDVPLLYVQDDPDPTQPPQTRSLSFLELVETVLVGSAPHLLLLGASGAGKTMFLHEYLAAAAQRRREIAFGRFKLPVFLPLKYYALFLQEQELADPSLFSLLDFLIVLDPPGLSRLRPYLAKLFRQGRLLLLCDGLDEVPVEYRAALDQELTLLFRQQRNHLVLTSTLEVYQQSGELLQVVSENLVPSVRLQALDLPAMRGIVERFITELDTQYRPQLPTAGQVMVTLERTRLRWLGMTPFYLFALLDVVDVLPVGEIGSLDTRGRLLREFVLDRLASTSQAGQAVPEDIYLLGDLACVARWNATPDFLRLPAEVASRLSLEGARKQLPSEARSDELTGWLQEQPVYFPFTGDAPPVLAEAFTPAEVLTIFQRATEAGLIDIDAHGLLLFRHPIIASALLAEYLARYLGTSALQSDVLELLPDDLAPWSEPLTLWAGLLEQPLVAAESLAGLAREFPGLRVGTLLLALICLGVVQTPPGAERQLPLFVPPVLTETLEDLLEEPRFCEELALLFLRCAEQGSPELYQALFPLLEISGIESWLALLEPVRVSELFFQRLVAIIDDPEQEALVKRLVRSLSGWGVVVVPRATRLCDPASSARLRTAMINVLGGTRAREAVAPLMACLRDADQFIVNRAANALTRLGPDLALPRLLQELGARSTASLKEPLYHVLLPILERFLNETNPARQLDPMQFELIIAALMALLNSSAGLADLEKVQEMLVSQGRLAAERESGKITINLLVQNLATAEGQVAQSMTGALKEVGEVATPHLLEQLERQTSESERVHILEILTSVRDPRALPALLHLLEDEALAVQQALATALQAHVPACIPGLLDVILHHADVMVAVRAEQILAGCGKAVIEPIIAVLTPVYAERTHLLVHVLECVGDTRAVPALVELLTTADADATLTQAIIQAFGQLADIRVVPPLLGLLASSNPLLYEEAINALSNLGELACPALLKRLDVPEKTALVARIERVLLGMQPFPADRLLLAIDQSNENQSRYLAEVFLLNGSAATQLLAFNLFHPRARIRAWVRQTMGRVAGHEAIPALLEVLNRPDPAWRDLVATYLRAYAGEAIPPLVSLLDDPERGEAAVAILLQAEQPVFLALVPALEASGIVRERARHIFVTLVHQQSALLSEIIQLFAQPLTDQVCEELEQLLTEDLADLSLPYLLAGLEDAHLVPGVSVTLLRLARRSAARSVSVLEELLQTLRVKARRYGAALTLVDFGALAVPGVGALITDADSQVASSARHILSEIGTPAFPFLWAAHSDASDPIRREAARDVFRTMPTATIKDELVELLTSARQEDISMALALLLERIHDEFLQPGYTGEMLSALLEHVQSSSDERASLRILALLILLGGPAVVRALINALYANPHGHERLVQTFLFLGQNVENDLLAVIQNPDASVTLQAEIAGVLAMRTPQEDVLERARSLSEHGLWAGRSANNVTTVLQVSQLEVSLRALGGLLVAGHWNSAELQVLRSTSKSGSAERELYDILLGWRYSPQLTRLEQELETERQERRQEFFTHAQELLDMKMQTLDLEHDLDIMRQENEEQKSDHTQKDKELQEEIVHLTRQSQALQADLRETNQEKLALAASTQQMLQEKERLQAEKERWQTYSQQLEKEIASLRRANSNA